MRFEMSDKRHSSLSEFSNYRCKESPGGFAKPMKPCVSTIDILLTSRNCELKDGEGCKESMIAPVSEAKFSGLRSAVKASRKIYSVHGVRRSDSSFGTSFFGSNRTDAEGLGSVAK
jgi:hypothetical protein